MKYSLLAIAVTVSVLLSCDENYTVNCEDCTAYEVSTARLTIFIRNAHYVPSNPLVTIYEGDMEDKIILESFTADEGLSYITYDALLFKDYTITNEFILNGQRYIIVDEACPKMRLDESSCDNSPCYFVYDNIVDLRPRYY